MHSTDAVLSLDIGTTGLKVGLFGLGGDLLQMEGREQPLVVDADGRIEQSPEVTWRLLVEAVRAVLADFPDINVAAIALSVQRGTVIPLSADGQPLSNFIVWMDPRGMPVAHWLAEQVGEVYYPTAGHPITYIGGASKVFWLQRNAPEVWEKAAVAAPPETYFLCRLGCPDLVCSHSSGTYLFPNDIDRQVYSQELADRLDFPLEKLPRLVDSIEIVGRLAPAPAAEFGLPAGIPLVPGGGDGQCAGVGCGLTQPGICMINIGTGTGVQTFLPTPLRDSRQVLNCAAHVIPGSWEMEGHTQSSGAVFRWFRDEFGVLEKSVAAVTHRDAFDLLVEQSGYVPPGASGLLFLPTFNGSTAPEINENARGVLLGLSLKHTRSHVIRAVLEGISLEIRWMIDAMIAAGVSINDVRLVGGGSRNSIWNQIHADIFGHTVNTLMSNEAALTGAAMCAAVACGAYTDFTDAAKNFVKVREAIEPRPENAAVYERTYQSYKELFQMLSQSGIFLELKN